ncbi:MAG TPA: hypothetical protein VIU61_00085 [Kofleriaceae bacterium]
MTDDQLRDLAKDLPHDRPDPARRDAVRSSLLEQVADEVRPTPFARKRWLVVGGAFAAGALAAAALALILVRDDRPLTVSNPAQITASSEARLEHRVVATDTGADEIVHVHDGTVRVAVPAPRRGDRSLLRTRDAEVEGVGEYEIVVAAEMLRSVTVRSGTAQIKVAGQRAVFLGSGQTWKASVITTDVSPTNPSDRVATVPPSDVPPTDVASTDVVPTDTKPLATATATTTDDIARTTRTDIPHTASNDRLVPAAPPPPTSPRVPHTAPTAPTATAPTTPTTSDGAAPETQDLRATDAKPTTPTARTSSVIEQRFQAGWTLLKQGKATEAAIELGAAADAAPNDPLAVDARYFQAVAHVRAGPRADAERVLLAFLDRSPRSLRRGRAVVLLGRLLGERGERTAAKKWLESALGDPDPAIAAAARAALEAISPVR